MECSRRRIEENEMGCSCNKKRLEGEAAAKEVAARVVVEVPTEPILVREGGHPLACEFCLEKHVAVAAVYAVEGAEEKDRIVERHLCIAHLSCAHEHAVALKRGLMAEAIAKAIEAYSGSGDFITVLDVFYDLAGGHGGAGVSRLSTIGALAHAEDDARRAGRNDFAEKIRLLRREFAVATMEQEK